VPEVKIASFPVAEPIILPVVLPIFTFPDTYIPTNEFDVSSITGVGLSQLKLVIVLFCMFPVSELDWKSLIP